MPSSSLLSALRHCCARPDPRCTTSCAAPASLARTGLLSGRLGVDVVARVRSSHGSNVASTAVGHSPLRARVQPDKARARRSGRGW
jgi:hypothetical protein